MGGEQPRRPCVVAPRASFKLAQTLLAPWTEEDVRESREKLENSYLPGRGVHESYVCGGSFLAPLLHSYHCQGFVCAILPT